MEKHYFCQEVSIKLKRKATPINRCKSAFEVYNFIKRTYDEDEINTRECAKVIVMNNDFKVLGYSTISTGGLTEVSVDVRQIMQLALLTNATVIAFVHNHPSGNPTPSEYDNQLTNKIKRACEVMRIYFLDHVIVTDEAYYSYRDMNKI